jgi:hypothetical protein
MELVLRPVSDRFFNEQLLPFLALCMSDSAQALQALQAQLEDEPSRLLCERLLSTHGGGGLGGMEQELWMELVDQLTFRQWALGASGWRMVGQQVGYAGSWDEALHLALMLEDPSYPYWDARMARGRRDSFRLHPLTELGLASLMGGQWEPFPAFPPDRIFSTQGRGEYVPRESYAFADWSWRPSRTVAHWQQGLERKLVRLLERERERLKPVELPETDEVLAYWQGRAAEPPALTVTFSGLGQRAASWVLELGVLTAHLRQAARDQAGLVALVTRPGSAPTL